ncbi:hypothetical protein AG1IA_09418 [Rhizoctonia solani AG-1 IA]|uniref:Uncharacterized protein n=1 Tax=Thanatephorus cucumeris (strain AG1-IA) TaxID=983506 RepID=L8WF11_THACA|nr:hypothetical protein AG1IA_09418 [Rhizoctonia solani AG-1 IA]
MPDHLSQSEPGGIGMNYLPLNVHLDVARYLAKYRTAPAEVFRSLIAYVCCSEKPPDLQPIWSIRVIVNKPSHSYIWGFPVPTLLGELSVMAVTRRAKLKLLQYPVKLACCRSVLRLIPSGIFHSHRSPEFRMEPMRLIPHWHGSFKWHAGP